MKLSHAKEVLTDFMEKNGFAVTRDLNVPDLETAWKAEWSLGNGGRTLGINAEMDALPEIGHAYVFRFYHPFLYDNFIIKIKL